MMRKLGLLVTLFLPWILKRFILINIFKFKIHPKAYIGLSFIAPKVLILEEGAKIGHFNVAVNLDKIHLGRNSVIGRANWITGFPTGTDSLHFAHDKLRKSELIVGYESSITKNHHIDCTHQIRIGNFVTIAGYSSQFLTHSIDLYQNKQDSHPILIGDYCFISTKVIVLGNTILPDNSVLTAGALLNKKFEQQWMLYGGVPAKPLKAVAPDAKYFKRSNGFVY